MLAGNRRPIQRRTEVGVLRFQLVQRGWVGVGRLALQRLCQVASPSQVAVPQLLCLTGIGQPVECVLADRLEQPVAPWVVQVDQRLVDQAASTSTVERSGTGSKAATKSAASRVKPRAKMPRRRNSTLSSGPSSS